MLNRFLPVLGLLLFVQTCTMQVDEVRDAESMPDADEPMPVDAAPLDPDDIPAPLTEADITGLPTDPMDGLSAYQRSVAERKLPASRDAKVLLGRIGVSEAGFAGALRDIPAIVQVARNRMEPMRRVREGRRKTLYDVLSELSPHVARVKELTRPRQRWTSTLPAKGDKPPSGWIECTSWYKNKKGRKKGLPRGCAGVWDNVKGKWEEVREFAGRAARLDFEVVRGNPWTWGGKMDLAYFLKNNPSMCLLESPGTVNYFFGKRDDPANFCIEPTAKQLAVSKRQWEEVQRADARRAIPAALAAGRK